MKSLLEQFKENNFLVTTDAGFTEPDGKMYRSVWGKIEIHSSENTLGIKTNIRSTNWYAIVGKGENRVIVAGCQIHYACVCMNKPNTENVSETRVHELQSAQVSRDGMIYLAQ